MTVCIKLTAWPWYPWTEVHLNFRNKQDLLLGSNTHDKTGVWALFLGSLAGSLCGPFHTENMRIWWYSSSSRKIIKYIPAFPVFTPNVGNCGKFTVHLHTYKERRKAGTLIFTLPNYQIWSLGKSFVGKVRIYKSKSVPAKTFRKYADAKHAFVNQDIEAKLKHDHLAAAHPSPVALYGGHYSPDHFFLENGLQTESWWVGDNEGLVIMIMTGMIAVR